jgi:hypothetical protein
MEANYKINCDSESDAQSNVKAIVQSVLRGLGLDSVVELVGNRTLAGVECDILLLYKPNRLPFATVEVKKPGNTLESLRMTFAGEGKGQRRNLVAGQVLDECNAIKLFGYNQVFGLITTGNMWRMVCTTPIATPSTAKTTTTGATSKKRRRGNANKTTKASQGDDDDKEVGNRLMAMNDRLLKTVLDFFCQNQHRFPIRKGGQQMTMGPVDKF